jgi:hypothetical protein
MLEKNAVVIFGITKEKIRVVIEDKKTGKILFEFNIKKYMNADKEFLEELSYMYGDKIARLIELAYQSFDKSN